MVSVREATFGLLRSLGMTTVFGNPGSTELPFLKDFPDDFDYVLGLQESAVLAMADGYAQATGRPTLVNLHTAPGLGNAMGMMVNAHHARSPLVVTAGQQDRRHLALEPLLHGKLTDLAKPYVKWSHEPARAEDVPEAIARACHTAAQEPQGPVFVSIPMDDWEAEVEPPEVRSVFHRTAPDPAGLQRVAEILQAATRPAIVAGDGVGRNDGWHEVVALAERLRVPVWNEPTSTRASFPQDHPLFQGHLAPSRQAVRGQLSGHDVVLVLGAAVFKYYPYTPGEFVEPGTHVVQITDDPEEAARAATGTSVVGNVSLTARALTGLLPATDRPTPPEQQKPQVPDATSPISVDLLMHTLNRVLPEDAVVVNEAVSSEGRLRKHVPVTRPGSFYGSAGIGGGLGFGMAGSVGVQLALPDRPVVGVIGEGAAMYTVQALWTAAHYGIPVTYVVVNNSQYAILKSFASGAGIEGGIPGLDLPDLDPASIARAFGVPAETVYDPAELEEKLKSAISSEGPYLLNVVVDPAVLSLLE
jgi:benzoylformate decarboxylase